MCPVAALGPPLFACLSLCVPHISLATLPSSFPKVSREWIKLCLEAEDSEPQQRRRSTFCRSASDWEPEALPAPKAVPQTVRLAVGHALLGVKGHWGACLVLCDTLARHFHAFVMQRFLPSALLTPWLTTSSGLLGCWEWKPIVPVKELVKALGLRGSAISRALHFLQEWRLLRPTLGRAEVMQWVAEQQARGAADLDFEAELRLLREAGDEGHQGAARQGAPPLRPVRSATPMEE